MKMFDKIKKDNKEYICLNTLYIEDKTIYQLYEENGEGSFFAEEKDGQYLVIKDKDFLKKINEFVTPETDIIIERM